MAELKMREFGASKYGEAIYIAGSALHPSIWLGPRWQLGTFNTVKVPYFFYEANWQANLVALSEITVCRFMELALWLVSAVCAF